MLGVKQGVALLFKLSYRDDCWWWRQEFSMQVQLHHVFMASALLIWEPTQFYRCTGDTGLCLRCISVYLFVFSVSRNQMDLLSSGLCRDYSSWNYLYHSGKTGKPLKMYSYYILRHILFKTTKLFYLLVWPVFATVSFFLCNETVSVWEEYNGFYDIIL